MTVFFILIFIPILRQAVPIRGEVTAQRKRRAMRVFFAILFLLLALRHETVGNDVKNYIHFFRQISLLEWKALPSYSLEISYTALNKLVSLITDNYQWFLAIVGALTVIPVAYQYTRNSEDPALTIVLFVILSTFYMFFSGLRQAIAVSLGMAAFEFTRRRRLIPFILTVLLAVTFHTSAFMIAFMYPLYHARITKKWLIPVVPGMIVLFIFNRQVFGFLAAALASSTRFRSTGGSTGAYAMIILFVLFFIYSFVIPEESRLDADARGLRNFLIMATALQMFAPLHALAMRVNYYYIIFVPLLIPKIIAAGRENWKQVAKVSRYVMIGFFLIYFFINIAVSDDVLNVYPYHFFWENVV